MALEDIFIEVLSNEITFQTARSGGAGGQNVNKVETKVILNFEINNSKILDEIQKHKLILGFKNYIVGENVVQMTSQEARTQLKNKELVVKKFKRLFLKSFEEKKERLKTQIPTEIVAKRLNSKKIKSEIKQGRGKIDFD